MRAIYINCKKQEARDLWMRQSLALLNISAERYDAVTPGSEMERSALAAMSEKGVTTSLRGNELSCFLSHYNIWRMVADGLDEHVLVLEDDVIFASDLSGVLKDGNLLNACPDIIRLEAWQGDGIVSRGFTRVGRDLRLYKHVDISGGSAAYILSRKGAVKLLAALSHVDLGTDLFLFRRVSTVSRELFIQVIIPCLAIQHDTLHRKRRGRLSKPWAEIKYRMEMESGRTEAFLPSKDTQPLTSSDTIQVAQANRPIFHKFMRAKLKGFRTRLGKELFNLLREVSCLFRKQRVVTYRISDSPPIIPSR